jgi:hypothetical protein
MERSKHRGRVAFVVGVLGALALVVAVAFGFAPARRLWIDWRAARCIAELESHRRAAHR